MFTHEIGIDLGTANTVVVAKRRGIVAKEPTVVAIDRRSRTVIAVGSEARLMLGRTPDTIQSVRPIQGGIVFDLSQSAALVKHMIRQIPGSRFFRPKVVMTVPAGASEVERRTLGEAARQAGASEVLLLEETLAAALGAGLPVNQPTGSLLVDIGSGSTCAAVIALGGVVVSASCNGGGDRLDEAVSRHMKREHNLLIGPPTAERVKIECGSALPQQAGRTTVTGRLLTTGTPGAVEVTSAELYNSLIEPLSQIDAMLVSVLERTPPELLSDICQSGLTLTGGGALLQGMVERLEQLTNLPVRVAETPQEAVAMGMEHVLANPHLVRMHRLKH